MKNQSAEIEDLKTELKYLRQAMLTLNHAYEHCKQIGIKDEYSYDELDKWEALTSRFTRISDIVTQKVFNSIMLITGNYIGSLIDKANFAEKHQLVTNADDFVNLRFLRNYIAHEYERQDTNIVFEKVMGKYSTLIDLLKTTFSFCEKEIFRKM